MKTQKHFKMYLFVGVAIIIFFLTYIQCIVKHCAIGSRLMTFENDPKTLEEIEAAKRELLELNKSELGDYAKMVRKMRAENKIKDLRQAMRMNEDMTRRKSSSVDTLCGNILKGIFMIVLAYISLTYRYTPVVVLGDRFNHIPFNGIIAFPTGVKNAISVPFWVLSCNLTFRWLEGVVKAR